MLHALPSPEVWSVQKGSLWHALAHVPPIVHPQAFVTASMSFLLPAGFWEPQQLRQSALVESMAHVAPPLDVDAPVVLEVVAPEVLALDEAFELEEELVDAEVVPVPPAPPVPLESPQAEVAIASARVMGTTTAGMEERRRIDM